MVTFSLPGDEADRNRAHKSRPPLPFASRSSTSSPFASSSGRRNGIPHSASARNFASSAKDNSDLSSACNLFSASPMAKPSSFAPSTLGASITGTSSRVFAPGATPESTRQFRASTAFATPKGLTAPASSEKELFSMRISSPPPELSGEALTRQVPQELGANGSIYADQFLAHLCPSEFDEEQRRQFFCVLDLRRLKYAANEIFARKTWKLNVINFAKEFEKSRSILLLRYGLYEFQNVKPSKEVLKRWRREHGLPEPAEDVEPSSKTMSSKKRKADDDLSSDTLKSNSRNVGKGEENEKIENKPAPSSVLFANKRKASPGEQSNKMQKTAPSSTRSLFERITNNAIEAASGSADVVGGNQLGNNANLETSFGNPVTKVSQSPPIGSHDAGIPSMDLSVDNMDQRDESDNAAETEAATSEHSEELDDAVQGETPKALSSGNGVSDSTFTAPSFPMGQPLAQNSVPQPGETTATDTGESTPGRSLFDRITKDSGGQPVRAEPSTIPANVPDTPAPKDQTWNPSTTPIKFATTASASAEKPFTTGSGALFGSQSSKAAEKQNVARDGNESDKENKSQPNKNILFEPAAPATQPAFGSASLPSKKSTSEPPGETSLAPSSASTFGSTARQNAGPVTSSPNFFGSRNKTLNFPASNLSSSSSVFSGFAAAKDPTENKEPSVARPFGQQFASSANTAPSIFGAKPAMPSSQSVFDNASKPTANIFGHLSGASDRGSTESGPAQAGHSHNASTEEKQSSAVEDNSQKGKDTSIEKPFFGSDFKPKVQDNAGKSPAPSNPFGQIATPFAGKPTENAPSGTFSSTFGSQSDAGPSSSTTGVLFGDGSFNSVQAFSSTRFSSFGKPSGETAADKPHDPNKLPNSNSKPDETPAFSFSKPLETQKPDTTHSVSSSFSFGADSSTTNVGSGSFDFNFQNGGSFNNPFASKIPAPETTLGGFTSFTAGSSQPASGASTPFPLGGSGSAPAAFPSNQPSLFGNTSTIPGAPSFTFGSAGASSEPAQGSGSIFGSMQAASGFSGLRPPAGGSSTTGTNSPLNFGGGSSLATTPAAGSPEPSALAEGRSTTDDHKRDEEAHAQISLTDGAEPDETTLHEVRAKVLKFIPPDDQGDAGDKAGARAKSSWSTQGIGPLRLLQHRDKGTVRLLLRAEPRGHVILNRSVMPNIVYKANEKYVKITTSNEEGDGLETWMLQVKTKDLATALAEVLEKHKSSNEI